MVADAERGVLLRCAYRLRGEDFDALEVEEIHFDEHLDAEVFSAPANTPALVNETQGTVLRSGDPPPLLGGVPHVEAVHRRLRAVLQHGLDGVGGPGQGLLYRGVHPT